MLHNTTHFLHPGLSKVYLPGKGRAFLANRTLHRGELLIHESPFVVQSLEGEKNQQVEGTQLQEQAIHNLVAAVLQNQEAFEELRHQQQYPIEKSRIEGK